MHDAVSHVRGSAVSRWRRRIRGHPATSHLAGTRWGRYHSDYADVARYFDRWADQGAIGVPFSKRYEQEANGHYCAPQIMSERILTYLPTGATVLDVGCGTGLSGAGLVRSGHRVAGVDISARMGQKALAKGYESVHVLDVTAAGLPWRQEFDGCVCVGLLGEWIRADALVPQLLNVLREKAVIGLTLDSATESREVMLEMLRAFGFNLCWQKTGIGFRKFLCSTIRYHYIVAERR